MVFHKQDESELIQHSKIFFTHSMLQKFTELSIYQPYVSVFPVYLNKKICIL